MNPISFSHVWKRYQLGLQHHTLRDAIPALLRRMQRRSEAAGAQEEGVLWALRDVSFDVPIERSSWVALRILGTAHTNPVFVVVGGKPIRASRRRRESGTSGSQSSHARRSRA